MNINRAIRLGALFAVCCILAGAAGATEMVDQSQSQSYLSFPVDYWSQTFTTGPNVYNLTAFDLDFGNANGASFYFVVRSVASYGTIIASTGWMNMSNGVQHISLATPGTVVPGQQYEIRVFDSTPHFSGDYYVKGATSNPYPAGTARFPGGGNDTFGHDWYFTTYFVPEPGSLMVLGSGLAGLAAALRRRG